MEKMSTVAVHIAAWIFSETTLQRNRMRENRSYGSAGARGGNEPFYPGACVLYAVEQGSCLLNLTLFYT
jgi:hypothetical protein